MANTCFEEIYSRCRGAIRNYDVVDMDECMWAQQEKDLLMMAIDDFSDVCRQDLSDYDEDNEKFNIELTRSEKKILYLGMVCHWLEPYVYNSDALQNALNTKDFSLYSPANLLEKMTTLLDKSRKKLRAEMNLYSFKVEAGTISGLAQ